MIVASLDFSLIIFKKKNVGVLDTKLVKDAQIYMHAHTYLHGRMRIICVPVVYIIYQSTSCVKNVAQNFLWIGFTGIFNEDVFYASLFEIRFM